MRKWIVIAVLALLGVIGLVSTASAASVVNVSSGNFWFEDGSTGDGQIVINAGDQLRVEIVEGTQHTVDINEFGIASGKMDTGAVYTTPPLNTPGTYTLFCRTHLNRGHRTTLVILGDAPTTTTTAPPPTTTTAAPTTTTTIAVTTTTTSAGTTTTTSAGSSTTAVGETTTTVVGDTTTTDPGDTTTTTEADDAVAVDGTTTTAPDAGNLSAEADTTGTTVAFGMVETDGPPLWHRSVWIGLLLLLPIGALTVLAIRRA